MCVCVSAGEQLFCKVSREISAGDSLLAELSLSCVDLQSPPLSLTTHNALVKEESPYPAALRPDIQLLPQQAGMAAILATAVVNSELTISSSLPSLPHCLCMWLSLFCVRVRVCVCVLEAVYCYHKQQMLLGAHSFKAWQQHAALLVL